MFVRESMLRKDEINCIHYFKKSLQIGFFFLQDPKQGQGPTMANFFRIPFPLLKISPKVGR